MSVYYNDRKDMLVLKCNGCGRTEDLYKGETDRLLANDWIHEHNWKTVKTNSGWHNLCPDCKEAFYAKRREKYLERMV